MASGSASPIEQVTLATLATLGRNDELHPFHAIPTFDRGVNTSSPVALAPAVLRSVSLP